MRPPRSTHQVLHIKPRLHSEKKQNCDPLVGVKRHYHQGGALIGQAGVGVGLGDKKQPFTLPVFLALSEKGFKEFGTLLK